MKMKKLITIILIAILSIIFLCGSVSAVTVSISASTNKVQVDKTVSVTVSLSQKDAIAQFKLNFDSSKFTYVSVSAGSYNPDTKTYVYVNEQDIEDLSSIKFTFKAKEVGTGNFSIGGVVLSNDASIGTSSASVTVVPKENNTTSSSNKNNNSNNSNKNNNTNNNQNKNEQDEKPTVENVEKPELEALKQLLSGKNKSDYTEESWNALQQVITEAEKITKKEDYEAIKPKLTSESLVPINFEKSELIDLLAELVGKTEENYTEESWEELQSAIETARNTDLKSEYDQVKNKLTLETLKEINEDNEEGTLSKLMGILQEHYILVIASVIGLIIIIILIIVICKKSKKKESRWSK